MGDFKLKITVVGMGLIGGSLAMALRKLNPIKLYGIDIDKQVLDKATSMGIIDKGSTILTEEMEDSDIILISIYPRGEVEFLKKYINRFKRSAIVTDTTGLKGGFQEEIVKICSGMVDYVGGHPMVGKETNSFEHASVDMLKGGSYIFTPSDSSKVENIMLLKNIAQEIGFTTIKVVDSYTHDKLITYTSHLPHVVAVAMMENDLATMCDGFTGGSFRDITRVARINENLWSGLFIDNKQNLISEIEKLQKNLDDIKYLLKNNDEEGLYNLLKKSRIRKEHQNEKNTGETSL